MSKYLKSEEYLPKGSDVVSRGLDLDSYIEREIEVERQVAEDHECAFVYDMKNTKCTKFVFSSREDMDSEMGDLMQDVGHIVRTPYEYQLG